MRFFCLFSSFAFTPGFYELKRLNHSSNTASYQARCSSPAAGIDSGEGEPTTTRPAGGLDFSAKGVKRQGREVPQSPKTTRWNRLPSPRFGKPDKSNCSPRVPVPAMFYSSMNLRMLTFNSSPIPTAVVMTEEPP